MVIGYAIISLSKELAPVPSRPKSRNHHPTSSSASRSKKTRSSARKTDDGAFKDTFRRLTPVTAPVKQAAQSVKNSVYGGVDNVKGRVKGGLVAVSSPFARRKKNKKEATTETESSSLLNSKRSGKQLWDRVKQNSDSLILMSPSTNGQGAEDDEDYDSDDTDWEHDDDEEVESQRKARRRDAIQKKYKSGLEFEVVDSVFVIILYLTIGMICYSSVFEKWGWIDALYFSMVTFCTVGYGDITPTNDWSRIFTCIYAIGGIGVIGIALGVVGSTLVDAQLEAIEAAKNASRERAFSLFHSSEPVHPEESKNADATKEVQATSSRATAGIGKDLAQEESSWKSMLSRLVELLPMILMLLVGAFFVGREAGWNLATTFYFVTITGTTVGYGDLVPDTTWSKVFAIVFIPISVIWIGECLARMANSIIASRQSRYRQTLRRKGLTLRDLQVMDEDGDGMVTRAEYLEFMLLAMEQVDEDLLDDLRMQFNALDQDGSGYLDKGDLISMAKEQLRNDVRRKLDLSSYKSHLLSVARKEVDRLPSSG